MIDKAEVKAVGVNFLIEENTHLHRTNKYKNRSLIVRRGQDFKLKVTFSRKLKDDDEVTLKFGIGENKEAYLYLNARSQRNDEQWQAKICETTEKECLIAVTSPADAVIGKYFLNVVTGTEIYTPTENLIYVLFNPWCKADSVFMDDEDKRVEYVLNDSGYLYQMKKPVHWNYGQFEEDILDCCMYLLDKSQLQLNDRRDPVKISRAFSALANANEDDGVLWGKWSNKDNDEDYYGGIPPLEWGGSVLLLQEYYKTKTPISYAQCWVFSGVLTTVMRCLGIPTRSVTISPCGIETEKQITINIYYDEKGKASKIPYWNYHVWNEVWMKRPDLQGDFDGWQVIDGTPPDQDKGYVKCGPASVKAIKRGEVNYDYDTMFIFSGVNADLISWRLCTVDGKKRHIKYRHDTKYIGENIITKKVGENEPENITDKYKFREGTPEERHAVNVALSQVKPSSDAQLGCSGPRSTEVSNSSSFKADIELGVVEDNPLCPGQPIDLNIVVKSKSGSKQTVDLYASCCLESYTGKLETSLATISQTVQTEGNKAAQIPLRVAPDVYIKTLASAQDELLLKVNIFADVQETNQHITKEVVLTFKNPPLQLKVPETAKVNETFTCEVIFNNTLSIPLQNCKLCIESLGIFPAKTFDQGNVAPGGSTTSKVECTAREAGEKAIVAKLNSNEVKGIHAVKSIKIIA